MPFYVQGDDKPEVLAGLIENAEAHWSYMDQYADRLILRGPTLSGDGEDHTGSVHVVDVDDRAAAERFAYEEPYWSAGFYEPLTVVRAVVLVNRTDDAPRTLVTAEWAPVEAVSPQLADGQLSFLALLVDDDGAKSVGLVAALTALPEEAAGIVSPVADQLNDESAMVITARRWQRGGRS
ncbi:YciI family protein [Kribbella catacumbae]|uniref:YciI family protein n=1 Tax=Kribbella catacumbae TaxID=460086 RepID=UPI0003700386|nr:YciI family protein [Kribbella catacumbae]